MLLLMSLPRSELSVVPVDQSPPTYTRAGAHARIAGFALSCLVPACYLTLSIVSNPCRIARAALVGSTLYLKYLVVVPPAYKCALRVIVTP